MNEVTKVLHYALGLLLAFYKKNHTRKFVNLRCKNARTINEGDEIPLKYTYVQEQLTLRMFQGTLVT